MRLSKAWKSHIQGVVRQFFQPQHKALVLTNGWLLWVFLVMLTAQGNWLLGARSRPAVWLLVASVGTLFLAGWALGKEGLRLTGGGLSVLLGVLPWLFMAVADVSWDGQSYHQDIIYRIRIGFNFIWGAWRLVHQPRPVYAPLIHFPILPHVVAAVLATLYRNVEAGKAIHGLWTLLVVIRGYFVLHKRGWSRGQTALLLSILVFANPVWITQIFTFYVDGDVYLLWLLWVLMALEAMPRPQSGAWLRLAMVGYFLWQTKISGLFLWGATLGIFAVWLGVTRRWPWRASLKIGLAQALLLSLLSPHPYGITWLTRGHPLFPLEDPKYRYDTLVLQQIPAMRPLAAWQKIGYSWFAAYPFSWAWQPYRDWQAYGQMLQDTWKAPHRLSAYLGPDARVGGWGPYLGLLVGMALLWVGLACWQRRVPKYAVGIWLSLMAVALFNPVGWWPRLVPFVWALWSAPLLIRPTRHKASRGLWYVLVLGFVLNAAVVGRINWSYAWRLTQERRAFFQQHPPTQTYVVDMGLHRGNRNLLLDGGYWSAWTYCDARPSDDDGHRLPGSTMRWWTWEEYRQRHATACLQTSAFVTR